MLLAAQPSLAAETAAVAAVNPDATLLLGDGQIVKLAGIETPVPPPERKPEDWPLSVVAVKALTKAALGHPLVLSGTQEIDRYDRIVANAETADDDVWLEEILLKAGLARVQTTPLHRERATDMLALERVARAQRLGLWRQSFYAIRHPGELEHSSGYFELVEGKIGSAVRSRSLLRLRFAGSTDELRFDKAALALFAPADPATLQGQMIRVRGWVRWYGSPVIEITHPEQIETLDQDPARSN